jgi:hypothetical protein
VQDSPTPFSLSPVVEYLAGDIIPTNALQVDCARQGDSAACRCLQNPSLHKRIVVHVARTNYGLQLDQNSGSINATFIGYAEQNTANEIYAFQPRCKRNGKWSEESTWTTAARS